MSHLAETAVGRLRQALDRIGDALVGARLDELLAAQPQLASALEELGRSKATGLEARAVAAEIAQARESLGRCVRLGESLEEAARLVLAARGAWSYDRTGREQLPTVTAAVDARA